MVVTARDIGDGPHKPFGGALKRRERRDGPLDFIRERPIRPKFGGLSGRCPVCGDRYFGCGHDEEDEE